MIQGDAIGRLRRDRAGWIRKAGALIFRRSSLPVWGAILLLAGAAAMLAVNLGTFAAVRASGNRATEALLRIETLLSTVKDAETGGRGYLLTGEEADLLPYHQALREIEDDLAAAHGRGDRRRPAAAGGADRHPTRARLEHLRRTVEMRRTAGPELAVAAVSTGEGRDIMRALRAEVSALQRLIVQDRDTEQRREWWRAMGSAGLAFGAGAMAALLLGLAAFLLRRTLASRDRSIASLLEERAGADFERISAGVLLDALPVGICLADASGRVVRTNAEAARLGGGAGGREGQGEAAGSSVRAGRRCRAGRTGPWRGPCRSENRLPRRSHPHPPPRWRRERDPETGRADPRRRGAPPRRGRHRPGHHRAPGASRTGAGKWRRSTGPSSKPRPMPIATIDEAGSSSPSIPPPSGSSATPRRRSSAATSAC